MSGQTYKPVPDGPIPDSNGLFIEADEPNGWLLRFGENGPHVRFSGPLRLCAPVAAPHADWIQAPDWANWWAVDPNGWAHWFQEEPILALTITYCGWVPKTINGVQQGGELWAQELDLDFGIDWRTLKEKRPEANNADEIPQQIP